MLSSLSVYEAVIGKSIADELGISVNDVITLAYNNSNVILTIVGIYKAINRFANLLNIPFTYH